MAGIVFLKTCNIEKVREFYIENVGMELWLKQANCIILKHENLLLGFCAGGEVDKSGIITFFYENREEVDNMYNKLKDIAVDKPKVNEKYDIYHFFAHDPEDRVVEFQVFLHPVDL
jgi:hypothetical protein